MKLLNYEIKKNEWHKKIVLAGLALLVFAFANMTVSAQHPDCPLTNVTNSGTVGDIFVIGQPNSTTVSVAINPDPGYPHYWGSVVVVPGGTVNANVNISMVNAGTKDTVFITANKIDQSQPATFEVLATEGLYGHFVSIRGTLDCSPASGCTLTQGYWKNHPNAWPVNNLNLGSVNYSQAQLIAILKTPVKGNGLVSLAYQLIAAKLNIASGASVPPAVAQAIADADDLIGGLVIPTASVSTSSTSSLVGILDDYNNGLADGGPSHCN